MHTIHTTLDQQILIAEARHLLMELNRRYYRAASRVYYDTPRVVRLRRLCVKAGKRFNRRWEAAETAFTRSLAAQ